MSSRDENSDANLQAVFDAGIAALPAPEALKPEDARPSQFSPNYEAAVEYFSNALDSALQSALKEAVSHD